MCIIHKIFLPQLTLPLEGVGILHFRRDEFCNDVSGVDVDGANGHDLLPIANRQVSQ